MVLLREQGMVLLREQGMVLLREQGMVLLRSKACIQASMPTPHTTPIATHISYDLASEVPG